MSRMSPEITKSIRLSTDKMTVQVGVDLDSSRIVEAPPIIQAFRGQPIGFLLLWMARQGTVTVDFL